MNTKYQIGHQYPIKLFTELETMEYLGEIKPLRYEVSGVNIVFDVWRRFFCGRYDLLATYNGKFFTRTYDNTVEGLVKAIGNAFGFKGKGYINILVGDIRLTLEEFQEQVKGLLTEKEISETISLGRYYSRTNNCGEIKWCPQCHQIRQTSCSACGCGNCNVCKYRWTCIYI